MKIDLNPSFDGMHGALGAIVYKTFDGQEIASPLPKPTDNPPSAPQVRQQNRFADANEYAPMVSADPVLKAPYLAAAKAEGVSTVFALMMGDYLKPPTVTEVDLYYYHGRIGDRVRIRATDDFEVVGVTVSIRTEAGVVLESGPAVKKGPIWIYTAQTVAPVDQDLTIEAEASDRAENSRTLSEGWHA